MAIFAKSIFIQGCAQSISPHLFQNDVSLRILIPLAMGEDININVVDLSLKHPNLIFNRFVLVLIVAEFVTGGIILLLWLLPKINNPYPFSSDDE